MAQVIWNTDIEVYDDDVMPLSIAKHIAKYLAIPDLVLFQQMLKNGYKAASNPALWVGKLKTMGVWERAMPVTDDQIGKINFEWIKDPIRCFDHIIKNPKVAKFQCIKIYSTLAPFYNDLLTSKPYDQLTLFKVYLTPEEQARILKNLKLLNDVDYSITLHDLCRDKINDLFEVFENALLRELEINYDIQDYDKTKKFVTILAELHNDQTLINFFLQKTIFDNEEMTKFFLVSDFGPERFFYDEGYDESLINEFISDLAKIFNQLSYLIDLVFPTTIPMMYKVCEELIQNQLMDLILSLIEQSKKQKAHLMFLPFFYEKMSTDFIRKLKPSENAGESNGRMVKELIDMQFETFTAEYMREETSDFKVFAEDQILQWNGEILKREQETTKSILKHVKSEAKNDFLSSFRKVFTISGSSISSKHDGGTGEKSAEEVVNYSKIEAKAKILSENLKSLTQIISPELVLKVINNSKQCLARLYKFKDYTVISLRKDIFSSMQEIFIIFIDIISSEHLKPGFDKAMAYLESYNRDEIRAAVLGGKASYIEPLIHFFEMINMADLIIQMIDIFYKEELINKQIVKHENSILNPSLQSKKKMEGLVDKYVADGLNVGIELLAKEIETLFERNLEASDYDPPKGSTNINIGNSHAAKEAIKILDENMDLLVDSADRLIVEVFQQEVAERFFQIIVKVLKRSTISVDGAIVLISDLNLYYEFFYEHIKTNKRMVMPFYLGLKNVGSLYLIGGEDSKAIGKLVCDMAKFNGIFRQEEIYELVQRRKDWPVIKKHVEKVMYGFGLGDCTIV